MPRTVRLHDGTAVLIRRIRPEDKRRLATGLARLSDASVHRRFLAPKPRFTARELRYLTEVDFRDHVAFVAVLAERPDDIVGVARWVRDPRRPHEAEAAITVADHLHGQGLGTLLGERLADAARERGVRAFTATMLSENPAAHRVFEHISSRLDVVHEGPTDALVATLAA